MITRFINVALCLKSTSLTFYLNKKENIKLVVLWICSRIVSLFSNLPMVLQQLLLSSVIASANVLLLMMTLLTLMAYKITHILYQHT